MKREVGKEEITIFKISHSQIEVDRMNCEIPDSE